MNLKLKDSPLRIASLETKAHKRSRMRIFYGNKLMHETEFVTDTSISRNKPVYGFLINDVETLSEGELSELLEYPEKYSLLLTPSLESEALKERIIKSGREYVLLLKDDINEVKYRLYEGYTNARLNGSVTNIMKSFGDARLFLLDDFENPKFGEQVLNLFEKRRIKVVPYSRYSQISEKDYISLPDDLSNHIKRSSVSDVFLISSKDFMQLYSEFKSLRKKGYKFITPSAMNYCL